MWLRYDHGQALRRARTARPRPSPRLAVTADVPEVVPDPVFSVTVGVENDPIWDAVGTTMAEKAHDADSVVVATLAEALEVAGVVDDEVTSDPLHAALLILAMLLMKLLFIVVVLLAAVSAAEDSLAEATAVNWMYTLARRKDVSDAWEVTEQPVL